MERTKDLAVVLRAVAFEDRHKIVTALTENHGRITVMARNSIHSRRFGGVLENFAAGEWIFTRKPGAEMAFLEEAISRRDFAGLRTDFTKLSAAGLLNEVIARVAPPFEACPDLFRLHSNALAALDELSLGPSRIELVLELYLAKILRWCGNLPALENCLGCSKAVREMAASERLKADASNGGIWCLNCARDNGTVYETFPARALGRLLDGLNVPLRQALQAQGDAEESSPEFLKFIYLMLAYHVPGFDRTAPKSLRFLTQNL